MARGWESKSVEQQQEQAVSDAAPKRHLLTPEQVASQQKRRGLELSRRHVIQQLAAASSPRHRDLLERTLADLDCQIQEISNASADK